MSGIGSRGPDPAHIIEDSCSILRNGDFGLTPPREGAGPWGMEREARITTGRGSQSLARILGGRGRQDRARRLLEHGDLAELARMAPRELAVRFALPHGAASRLSAAFDLGRRVEQARRSPRASGSRSERSSS